MVEIIRLAFDASSWSTNHFIRKPVRGGSPPRDKITNTDRIVSHGAKFIAFPKSARLYAPRILKAINTALVIII